MKPELTDTKGLVFRHYIPRPQLQPGTYLSLTGDNPETLVYDWHQNQAGAFTVSAWVRTTDAKDFARVVTKPAGGNQNYSLTLYCGRAQIRYDDDSGAHFMTSDFVVSDGEWHCLTGVRDEKRGRLLLYVDGQLAGITNASSSQPAFSYEPLCIGRHPGGGSSQNLAADVCRVLIWSGVRYQSEIVSDMTGGVPVSSNVYVHKYY